MSRKFIRIALMLIILGVFALTGCDADEGFEPNLDMEEILANAGPGPTETPAAPELPGSSAIPEYPIEIPPPPCSGGPPPEPEPIPEPTPEPTPTPEFRHVNIPILMYHTSSEYNPGALPELYVRPSEFERQMVWLIENGFTFVTFEDWDYLYRIKRPIMITFDDGYIENYTEIFPILQEHNVTIVLFLTWMAIAGHGFTEDMILAMHDSGLVVFEAHTMTHVDLRTVGTQRLRHEMAETNRLIEELTGRMPIALAYPGGRFNDAVLAMTAEYYRFGLRHDLGMHNTAFDNFQIRRIRINRSTGLDTFIRLVTQ
ncbi:MAG: polysaccharide deacetylase family protein [Defluviitaleaceae bacterium]|nr:polysaccharide deacetylase family protein [Defluviitaleaceae bacterium]